ncbi:MAG: DUF4271 domain-containing protein [Polaribacter sp.]
MQALERVNSNDYWVTIVLVCLLIAVFFLKLLDAKKLKGYAFSMFSRGFIEDEIEENIGFFNSFQILISFFSGIVISLLVYNLLSIYGNNFDEGFYSFCIVFLLISIFFLIKRFLEYALTLLFNIKKPLRFYLVSKFSYLFAICFLLFFGLVLVAYAHINIVFLVYSSIALFAIRFVLHVFNNKKLIFSKLFYFILYFCAFEIAPLLILFKLMF